MHKGHSCFRWGNFTCKYHTNNEACCPRSLWLTHAPPPCPRHFKTAQTGVAALSSTKALQKPVGVIAETTFMFYAISGFAQ